MRPPRERANKMTLGAREQMIMSHVQKELETGRGGIMGVRGKESLGRTVWIHQARHSRRTVGCRKAIRKRFQRPVSLEQWGQKANRSGRRSEWEARKWCQ